MATPQAVGFKAIQLFKDQVLGIGSYGKVFRAKCNELLCAAKLIHETLFDPTAEQLVAPQREHRLPMRRFEQECQFLSTVRHPNVVQYLGIYEDPDTGLPALLMELMDDSLTHFLESSTQPIPYHIAVNICHDIALALSFLHSNDIVHRDLSSNNVLLIGNVRAKVTDFGMARLGDQNPRATHLTFTLCPGTDVFMPPEAVRDRPVYTEKIDCFSFGVITLQMLTRKFPKPGDRRKVIEISHPDLPGGIAEVPVSEIERRQNHISEVDPDHPLLQVTLDCLKDRDIERPSAQQLCERVAALKESQEYGESVRATQERNMAEQGRREERERELRSLRQQHDEVVRQKDEVIAAGQEEMEQLRRENEQHAEVIAASQRQLGQKEDEIVQLRREEERVHQQLEESEQVIAQFQRRIDELDVERRRSATQPDVTSNNKQQSQRDRIKMRWKEGRKAPCEMSSYINCAIADDTMLYVRKMNNIYSYTASTSIWSPLPDSPTNTCPFVIIHNLLTLVGGLRGATATNHLLSLTGEGSGRMWTEVFPAMPTKRYGSTALCTGTALIVAGGSQSLFPKHIKTVEVMNTETLQWSTAADLPHPLLNAPGAVCGDHVYILSLEDGSTSMYACSESVSTLLQSCRSRPTAGVWNRVTAPPVTGTTCVSIDGRLFTIGGRDFNNRCTSAIYMYDPIADSWEVIDHMATPRYDCSAAVLPNNQLMVVGGETCYGKTDSVEIATLEY